MSSTEADRGPTWRRAVAMTLVVVASIAAPLAITAVFVRNQVLDTDKWVETVAPLAENPVIQERVAYRTAEYLTTQVDINAEVESLLPDVLPERFADTISAAVEGAVVTLTERFVASDAFATVWREANRVGHASVSAVLTGDTSGPIQTEGGQIVVDLRPVAEGVIDRLSQRGVPFFDDLELPEGEGRLQFVVAESDQLESAQDAVDLLQTLAWVLAVVTIVAAIVALAFSTDRWRTLWNLGIGFMIGAIVLGVALILGQWFLLDQLPASASSEAANVVYDTMLRNLKAGDQVLFTLGAVASIAGWLARAWRSRDWFSTASLRLAGLVVAGVLLLWPADLTPLAAGLILLGLLGYLIVVGFLSKPLGSEEVPPVAPADGA